jgi:tetratricopeptide (TPR) repeat protein
LPIKHIAPISALIIILMSAGCASQNNTAKMRFWHSFNAKYNIYYNGELAYIDGCLEKENSNKDDYTDIIPLYTVGNKKSATIGKGNFDRAIEKCEKAIKRHSIKKRPEFTKNRKKTPKDIEWLNRREYNPFLWKAWLLMGESQFQKGSFDESASTFSYMSRLFQTQPEIYGIAKAWLARCYTELGWMYDAEDVMVKMQRDTMTYKASKIWDGTYADYYIRQGRIKDAIPYLRSVIKHEKHKKQKAREWFLMGQLYGNLENKKLAYQAFKKVIRQNPPYELEFNARIAQTEVMAQGSSKQMINRLKRMAASDKNKDYLDQVYYAIGNIYLTQHDTLKAISEYEKGVKKATRSGIEKGVLLLNLGNLYWNREKFSDAKRCYGEAIGLLDKDRPDYEELSARSTVLDELVPHTEAVYLQDSLQTLAKMSEADRNKAIDRVITALKKKEKEEKDATDQAALEKKQQQQGSTGNLNTNTNKQQNNNTIGTNSGLWYFYNSQTVNQGKSTFEKQWGKRQNADDWQRNNKTVVASANDQNNENQEEDNSKTDSLKTDVTSKDSIKSGNDTLANDPHNREYYLTQIPFTDDQIKASNKIIEDGLYNSGIIFKDKLNNLALSEKALRRLTDDYSEYESMDNVYYHLFLLYSRMDKPDIAENYVKELQEKFPNSKWTTLLSDPNYAENAKFGVHLEDSLYASTYDAFKAEHMDEVKSNSQISEKRFPMGANRPKFLFIDGMRMLNIGDQTGCIRNMKEVVEKYPKSDVSTIAGMIVKGVQEGRTLHGGKLDLGSIWERRMAIGSDSDNTTAAKAFSAERNTNFMFILAYQEQSLNENQLLYELARYNFTNFMVRNFDITIDKLNGVCRMIVRGFLNYDETLQYARQLYSDKKITEKLKGIRRFIISEDNLKLIGTRFSYEDYENFYDKTFAPMKISDERLLQIPESIEHVNEKKSENKEEDNNNNEDNELW